MIDPAAAAWFGATCLGLWLKGTLLSGLQVGARIRARAFARAEDARFVGLAPATEPAIVERIAGAWKNEHENGPAFLSLSAAYVLLGGAAAGYRYAAIVFVAARAAHAVAQAGRRQPLRTLAFLVGVLATAWVAVAVAASAARLLSTG
jgi:uncharacterized MAPEG superfamily protein